LRPWLSTHRSPGLASQCGQGWSRLVMMSPSGGLVRCGCRARRRSFQCGKRADGTLCDRGPRWTVDQSGRSGGRTRSRSRTSAQGSDLHKWK
jgi:hypothetical protein